MTDAERLSLLLDGELPPEEAAQLRARIDAEPHLAALWATMLDLPEQLAGLEDAAPPPELDAAVLDGTRSTSPTPSPLRWMPWLVAAAAMLFAALPTAQPTLIQTDGTQVVEGDVVVLAGGVEVAVSGAAEITVEPAEGVGRVTGAEARDMDKTHLLSALAGSAVTVAVLSGSAAIHSESQPPTDLGAGEAWSTDGGVAPAPTAPGPEPYKLQLKLPIPGTADVSKEDLQAQVDSLRDQLAELEFAHGLAKGQLSAVQGEPQPWPADLPRALTADHFEDSLLSALEGVGGAEIIEVDCSEFPCLAIVQSHSDADDWVGELEPVGERMEALSGIDDFGVMHMAGEADRDGDRVRMLGVAYFPGDGSEDGQRRAQFRGQQMLQDAMHDGMPEGTPP